MAHKKHFNRKVILSVFDAHGIPRVLVVSVSHGMVCALDEKAKAQGKGLAGYVREGAFRSGAWVRSKERADKERHYR